jgi:hypothetical protein
MITAYDYTFQYGTRTVSIEGLTFVWSGGTYIDIYANDQVTDMNINVKNSATNELLIENSKRGFIGQCKRWYREATA